MQEGPTTDILRRYLPSLGWGLASVGPERSRVIIVGGEFRVALTLHGEEEWGLRRALRYIY